MSKKKRFILSIDGGGIRGLIPLRVLESLESRLAQRAIKEPMHKHFDLMCGTSTGGLIVAGLAAPKPGGEKGEAAATIKELRDFYELEARDIFTYSLGKRLARAFINPFNLFDETYDARPLERLLKERFGWTSMASALTKIVLTSYDIEQRKAVFMTNGLEENGSRPNDYYFWQAVRATTAAPSYFEPARVENLSTGKEEAMVDGGVFMNDPAMAAYLEARKLGFSSEDTVIISLGTGQSQKRPFPYKQAIGWGALGWMQPSKGVPILSMFSDGQSQTASYQASRLFTELGSAQYYRLNGVLDPESEDFDNARPGNLIALNGTADRIIRDETVMLDRLADMLRDNAETEPTDATGSMENAA
ncbi:patatin-like phospholipase/acyl hydrolase [Roseibium hamelinense]|uniref:Patatin-like phospholipase/acyl hydrolase n=1 Tax=Roseibium hamelinense TaxID=150831 RepID=A0A562SHX2_9HYPH|nr:patatin-like phospholipase family protein [Roseibium hamelinense]MTI42484.1 patatin [Roseibium hamelinense]TWI80718.1 patatin-like phospholipase/acyl hydrolase [Roseibium hamelinense]